MAEQLRPHEHAQRLGSETELEDSESDASSGRAGKSSGCPRLKPDSPACSALGCLACLGIGLLSCWLIWNLLGRVNRTPMQIARAPSGTNFGGWLVLEDWFFSGDTGVDVMSTNESGQGICLPPVMVGSDEPWPSEGILVQRLNNSFGPNKTVEVFQAHRNDYIGDSDLDKMAQLGITTVRIPITWAAFADALSPIAPEVYGRHEPNYDTVVVPDPFYVGNASLVTIPRALLAGMLGKLKHRGMKALFDVHAMPGGSSDGTYNGVWPMPPVFWKESATVGDSNTSLARTGLMVVEALIQWVERLEPEKREAVGGLTLMNEPAHMAAIRAKAGHPFAEEAFVLAWLKESADLFRKSSLPDHGVKLYVNMIETSLADFWGTVPDWWSRTFSREERHSWAVLDIHWYTAWAAGTCDGRLVPGGMYVCNEPMEHIHSILEDCVEKYAKRFSDRIDGLRAISEFSLGTYSEAALACDDPALLRMFLEEQVSAFDQYGIEPFFWTWKMPYGKTFERGWSLKRISGLEEMPPVHRCSKIPSQTGLTLV